MLPVILEKAIINGWAQYRLVNFAYGSFESLKLPDNSFAVITTVIWNHFVNPPKDFKQGLTWGEFFESCEYQLKIESDVKIDYLQFRNSIKWTNNNALNPIVRTALINDILFDRHFIQEPNPNPIILETYLQCIKFINLSVTRNAFTKSMVSTNGLLNKVANQQPAPNALGDSQVILDVKMTSNKGSVMDYVPPGYANASINSPTSRQLDQYNVDISLADVNSYESNLQTLDTTVVTSSARRPFTNFPLITLGVVIINNNYVDKIKA